VVLAVVTMGALWMALWIVLAVCVVIGGESGRAFVGAVAGSAFYSACVLGVAVGMSAVAPRDSMSLMVGLIIVSAFQPGLWGSWPVSDAVRIPVELLLFPVAGISEVRHWLNGTAGTMEWWRVAHAVVYPCVWIAIGAWRVKRDDAGRPQRVAQPSTAGVLT
jgi:hypothetical protein